MAVGILSVLAFTRGMMKNYWLDKKEKKSQAAKELWDEVSRLPRRKDVLTKYVKRKAKAASDAVKCTSKTCVRHDNSNTRYLQEAQSIAARWEKTGLLDGITNRWSRQVTAVILEGQRLFNEQKYNLKVRTKNTERRHGYNTLEELCRYVDLLADDMKHYITFSSTGDCQPADDQEMVLTIYENTSYFTTDSKILCPKSAGGDWDGYDEHRRQAVKK